MNTQTSVMRTTYPETMAGRLTTAHAARLLLPLLVLLSVPALLQAQFNYTTNNGTITITGPAFQPFLGAFSVPSEINGRPVTSIGEWAFGNTGLSSITMPDSVTSIGASAFYCCPRLENVAMGNSVTNIGAMAFYLCGSLATVTIPTSMSSIGASTFYGCTGLKSMTIPNSVTSIGNAAFSQCTGLTNVMIPNSVASIGQSAFNGCLSLTTVTVPNSVTSIGILAFDGCANLTSIAVDALNTAYSSLDGVLFNKTQDLLCMYPQGKTGAYTIPNNVRFINGDAFMKCAGLTRVTIPNSLVDIGCGAFTLCTSLTAFTVDQANMVYSSQDGVLFLNKSQNWLVLYPPGRSGAYHVPGSVVGIASEAFSYCYGLTSVTIPNSLTTILDRAFLTCPGLSGVYFEGNAPTTVGADVFANDNNATVYYLPGTQGWGPTFYGLPTVMLNTFTGTITGTIAFKDLKGNLLTESDKISANILIRVWNQNTAYIGTQTDDTNLALAEARITNSRPTNSVQYSVSSAALHPLRTYDLGVSASGSNDWKVVPITIGLDGTATTDITISYTNLLKNWLFDVPKPEFTYRFHSDWSQDESNAVVFAMTVWQRTGLIRFQQAPWWNPTADVDFQWDHLGAAMEPGNCSPYNWITFNRDWPRWAAFSERELIAESMSGVPIWHFRSSIFDYLLSSVAIHEIGHALGLRLTCPGGVECDYSITDFDNQQFSVMSYRGQLGWLGYSDVLALKKKQIGQYFTVRTTCPVDIILTLPDGRIVSKTTNSVAGATYVEEDINGDGSLDDIITLTQLVSGNYSITVVPEFGADPTNKVTLTVQDGERETVLLNAVPIAQLPTNQLPVQVDRTPPTLAVKATPGVITGADGRMVPVSVEVQVSDEDTNVVVALLGVISSDGPDTNAVTGAKYETDDRSFQVQAASVGLKRVYTIVCAASDSSGNVSQARTDVVVIAQPGGILLGAAQYDPTTGITLRVFTEPGRTVAIEASQDLRTWTEIGTVSLAEGSGVFNDAGSLARPRRYYRAVLK